MATTASATERNGGDGGSSAQAGSAAGQTDAAVIAVPAALGGILLVIAIAYVIRRRSNAGRMGSPKKSVLRTVVKSDEIVDFGDPTNAAGFARRSSSSLIMNKAFVSEANNNRESIGYIDFEPSA